MDDPALITTILLAAVAALLVLARTANIPYPVVLFVGGTALGLTPGLPEITLDPEVLLLGILPPLLFAAAAPASLKELRDRARAVSLLTTLLVLGTTVAVAVAGHAVIGLDWPVAFVLGAVVSPTDPIAATAIASRLGAPARVSGTLENEGLINDASALVLYKVAVGAATTGSFSLLSAGWTFLWGAVVGVAFGALVGWLLVQVLARVDDAPFGVVASMLGAYLAYLPVEVVGGSAVLGTVTAGLVVGSRSWGRVRPTVRIEERGFWKATQLALNAVVFAFVGLELPVAFAALDGEGVGALVGHAALIIAVVVGVRFFWMFTVPHLVRFVDRREAQRERRVGWRERAVVGWSGMRGAVSLAAALAVPVSVGDRDLVIVLTYAVIVWTLVVQGLTLPLLIRRLGVVEDGSSGRAEADGRAIAAQAALDRLESLRDGLRDTTYERVQGQFRYRAHRWSLLAADEAPEREAVEERSAAFRDLMRDLVDHQRLAVRGLHEDGRLPSEALQRIENDLDLDHARMEE